MYNKNLYSDGTSEDSEGKDSSFESVNLFPFNKVFNYYEKDINIV